MALISVSGQEAASNTDILQGTRLQTIGPGKLIVELQASDNDATNNYTATLLLANGNTPLQASRVPCGNTAGLAGVLDDRTYWRGEFNVRQTGHVTLSCVEAGSAELTWRVSSITAL